MGGTGYRCSRHRPPLLAPLAAKVDELFILLLSAPSAKSSEPATTPRWILRPVGQLCRSRNTGWHRHHCDILLTGRFCEPRAEIERSIFVNNFAA